MVYTQIPVEDWHPTESGKVIVCFNIFDYKLDNKGEKTDELVYVRSHKFETDYTVSGGKVCFPAIFEKIETVTHVIIPL